MTSPVVLTWLALASLALSPCAMRSLRADEPLAAWQGQTMGSVYHVRVVGTVRESELAPLKQEVDERLREVNRQMSHYQPDSELSRFNRAPANVPFKVSPELARVVRFTLELCRESRGALDPTLAPVINLWGFGEQSTNCAVPADSALREALRKTGYRHLTVTPQDELMKAIPGLTINLSAVAKGFGVDEMSKILQRHGHTNFYAAIAGEVRVMGHNARGTRWQIGICEPISNWRESDPMATAVALSDQAISTSGDYQKFFLDPSGRRLCHIFNAQTGWPVQHNVGGVSVVARDNLTADALSTMLFVMGVEEGIRFINGRKDAAALFIIREGEGRFRQVPSARFAELTGYQL